MYLIRLFLILFSAISIALPQDINLNELIIEAVKTDKHLLVYLHTTGCDYCLRMEEFTLDNDSVQEAIQTNFIFVDINVKDKGFVEFDKLKVTKYHFAKEIGYPMYPSCLFFDKNGELVYDMVGYRDEDKLLQVLDYVHHKKYNDF